MTDKTLYECYTMDYVPLLLCFLVGDTRNDMLYFIYNYY